MHVGTKLASRDRCSRRKFIAAASILLATSCTASGVSGVHVSGLDSPEPRRVGTPPGPPVWSPDGDSLIWPTERGIEHWNAADGNHELLVPDGIAGLPAYSPDGRQIAYVRFPDPQLVVFGVEARRVDRRIDARSPATTAPMPQILDFGGPSWSPDGRQLAYSCWDGAGDEVCVVNVATSEVTQVTRLSEELRSQIAAGNAPNATSNMGPPAWSPDGTMIAVAAYPERRGAANGLFVIDVARGSARRLSELQPNSVVTWAADSSAVLFSAQSGDRSDVFMIPLAGGAPANVTEAQSGSSRNPAFLAGGRMVAASSDGAIVVLRGNSADGRIHLEGLFADFPATRPGRNEISFLAAPDLIQNFRAT